jgi:hypothetical protein
MAFPSHCLRALGYMSSLCYRSVRRKKSHRMTCFTEIAMDIRLNWLVHVFRLEPANNDYMNSHGHQTLIKISIYMSIKRD